MEHDEHSEHGDMRDVEGTSGNDTLRGADDHSQRLMGGAGDDVLIVGNGGGGVFAGNGNDTMYGGGSGTRQSHMYAGKGDDVLYLNPTNDSAPHGEHVWGEEGRDKFIFNNVNDGTERIVGRIEDYDRTQDEIWVDDVLIDFENLPDNVRVVELYDQPWILINERILYTLEGARIVPEHGRGSGDEVHFIDWPEEWADGVPASADINYKDMENFFPSDEVATPEGGFNDLRNGDGTDGHDYYYGNKYSELIEGKEGNDLLMGNEGHDEIYGGAGDDSISGGVDRDLLYGGTGDDVVYGGGSDDTIHGGNGDDTLYGNHGDDMVFGGAGDDELQGHNGNDILVGGEGGDRIWGGNGKDILIAGDPDQETPPEDGADIPLNRLGGGSGNDILFGADYEKSVMTGGQGDNTFVAAGRGEIAITDFKMGQDTLNLAGRMALDQRIVDIARVEEIEGEESDLILDLNEGGSVRLIGLGGVDVDDLLSDITTTGPELDPSTYLEFTDGITEDHPDYELHSPFMVGGDQVNVYDPDVHGPGEYPLDGGDGTSTGDDEDDDDPETEEDDNANDQTCFVATASFGEARHPDVTWLRTYRDEVLVTHPLGRAFIRAYWRYGPSLARKVRHDGFTGKTSRRIIGRIVTMLKKE
ncbi:MAG: calcium-binding protein [Roseibium sp.]|uniref:calcium-binding protein n=1 Tax=Roseibium sp. TaxID=1936156 RepID=UPI003297EE96